MKKLIATVSAIALAVSSAAFTAFAANSVNVSVTISDGTGTLPLAQQSVAVTDIDADGTITINDALVIAHNENYDGGAEAGYASGETEYGISLNKLWGVENGGSYGYCVNNTSAMSLMDEVKDGDYISAYAYSDLSAWSDAYCWFNVNTADASAGETLELTLSYAGYDPDWSPITLPVSGAVITVNGEQTELVTDKNGNVTISLDNAGEYLISAVSDMQTLVPPVCKATVTASDSTTEAPKTGNSTSGLVAITAIALAAACLTKKNEK